MDNQSSFSPSKYPEGIKTAWSEYVKNLLSFKDSKIVLVHPETSFYCDVEGTYVITQTVGEITNNRHSNDRTFRNLINIEEPIQSHLLTESNSHGKWQSTYGSGNKRHQFQLSRGDLVPRLPILKSKSFIKYQFISPIQSFQTKSSKQTTKMYYLRILTS